MIDGAGGRRALAQDDGRGLRRPLLLGYFGLCVVLVVGAVFLTSTIRERDRAVEHDDEVFRPGQVAARDLLGFAVDQETGQRGYLLTGDPSYLDPYELGRAGSTDRLTTLTGLFGDDAELSQAVERVGAALATWQREAAEPEILAAGTSLDEARRLVVEGNGKQLFDEFRTELQRLVDTIDTRSSAVQVQRNRAFRSVVLAAAVATGAVIALATLTLALSRVWISRLAATQRRLRSTVGTLQAGLVPQVVPVLDHAQVAVGYEPATDDLEIGGDFYGVVQVSDATLAITIGDVCGHDVAAAVLTGMVRHTISAACAHVPDPAEVLRWANQAIVATDHGGRFVSVAHAHLDTPTGVLRLALGGHPRPILLPGNDDPAREIGGRGMLLGITNDLVTETVTVMLQPGDQVLFYTDGLFENSQPRLDPDALLRMTEHSRGDSAAATVANLLDRYRRLSLRASRDDLAVAVLRFDEPSVRA